VEWAIIFAAMGDRPSSKANSRAQQIGQSDDLARARSDDA
jgi:hypothetical protein